MSIASNLTYSTHFCFNIQTTSFTVPLPTLTEAPLSSCNHLASCDPKFFSSSSVAQSPSQQHKLRRIFPNSNDGHLLAQFNNTNFSVQARGDRSAERQSEGDRKTSGQTEAMVTTSSKAALWKLYSVRMTS